MPDDAAADSAILGAGADALPASESDATVADAAVAESTVVDETDANAADDASDADASCGDTTSDPHNCGACGHDCLGGMCSTSLCQPVALVTAAQHASPSRLAQDDTFLYWTDEANDKVYRTAKTGNDTLMLTQSAAEPIPIAVDDAGIYWGGIDGIWVCPKTGCGAGPTRVAQVVSHLPRGLAVDQGNVYWTEEGAITVLFAPKSALNAPPGVLWQSDTTTIMWGAGDASDFATEYVAADGQRVYFTASDGRVRAVSLDGGGLEMAGTPNQNGASRVTLDTSYVYWAVQDPAAGVINRAATGTLMDAEAVASGLSSPEALATDGTNVYWAAASSDGSGAEDIFGCVMAACQPARLAGGYIALAIVVDAQAVYWTDNGMTANSGAVWKLAK